MNLSRETKNTNSRSRTAAARLSLVCLPGADFPVQSFAPSNPRRRQPPRLPPRSLVAVTENVLRAQSRVVRVDVIVTDKKGQIRSRSHRQGFPRFRQR